VRLVEMRPTKATPAHRSEALGELVCTNSFKSEDPANAHGQLKREMSALGSALLESAAEARVPAGAALAVDRELFSAAMTRRIAAEHRITVERSEVTALPEGPAVVATGPLTSDALAYAIQSQLGEEALAFFDAIAPIVDGSSIDLGVAFPQGRWDQDPDYLNCPMTEEEYRSFVDAVVAADVHDGGHDWDEVPYFEGCLPIEVLASRGPETLRFGPMKPLGLRDPRTGKRPHAVVQLRREDRAGQMWNLVGFQTRLRIPEQTRVFRTIPGLAGAEFLRFGSIHRNSYLNFPLYLGTYGAPAGRPDLIFAGQLTGVEGYTESAASGILAGLNLDRLLRGESPRVPPPTTMLGGLYRYLAACDPRHFQPMNSNWGLVDPLPGRERDKVRKRERLAERASDDFALWIASLEGAEVDLGTALSAASASALSPVSARGPSAKPVVAEVAT
jgi:methylenetetrahydrofolate--tRNA-(uracil-5-)-methyltransferase